MSRCRLLQSLFFLPLLFSFTTISETGHGNNPKAHASPPEQSTPDKEVVDKTQSYYRIHRLRFNGNRHLNQDRLLKLFGWEKEKVYTRSEIIEGFEQIVAAYRGSGFRGLLKRRLTSNGCQRRQRPKTKQI